MAEETTPTPETQQPDEFKGNDKLAGEEAPPIAETQADESKTATLPAKPKSVPAEAKEKPAAAKKPKAPALEDKPFEEFMTQDFTPALKKAFMKEGVEDIDLTFKKDKLAMAGSSVSEQCWQVKGNWQNGQRQFNLYFIDENINGKKAFSYSVDGVLPSTIESFMIDERKVTLDLLIRYTIQRLNGQKWLTRN